MKSESASNDAFNKKKSNETVIFLSRMDTLYCMYRQIEFVDPESNLMQTKIIFENIYN